VTWKIGYKALYRAEDGTLWSCTLETYGVCYPPRMVIVPRFGDGPLAVFESVETAWRFLYDYLGAPRWTRLFEHERDRYRIYKCKYLTYPARWRREFIEYMHFNVPATREQFYTTVLWQAGEGALKKQLKISMNAFPEGTRFARAVKLLVEVPL